MAACLVFTVVGPVVAEGISPVIPMGTGAPHPEGNDFMRRWHMEMMKHDRDETMYQGVRPVSASLSACFDCHTVKDAAGTPVTVADERHFCRTCHDFAAVRIDCFDCHRSTPEGFEEPPAHAANTRLPNTLRDKGENFAQLQAYLTALPGEGEK